MSLQVVCLGAVNLDLIYRVEDLAGFLRDWGTGLAPGGEEALTPDQESRLQPLLDRHARLTGRSGGGQAANTAFALARLGVATALIGHVGADADGEFLRQGLAEVDLTHLKIAGASGRAYILVDAGGERTILVAPNTNDDLQMSDIPLDVLAGAQFLHLTSFVGEAALQAQCAAANRLPPESARITLDPGELYARRGWQNLEDLLDHTETLLVTEREWQLLGGDPQVHPAWAPPVVLLKLGARGARLLTPLRYLDFPSEFADLPVDTLGAGDVFAAGYLAGRLHGLHLNTAVRLGNRAAAVSLRGPGRENYPDHFFLERQLGVLD
jgi:ribokinase